MKNTHDNDINTGENTGEHIANTERKTATTQPQVSSRKILERKQTHYERTRAAVYATGNKWAIENFHMTHD